MQFTWHTAPSSRGPFFCRYFVGMCGDGANDCGVSRKMGVLPKVHQRKPPQGHFLPAAAAAGSSQKAPLQYLAWLSERLFLNSLLLPVGGFSEHC